ncbi:hypothetical protein C8Q78DRAFT_1052253 [Trametes maxima]|nr:hypothetical protein C8Q78DRAFT_1052253 [Trametes maxima]
MAETDATGAQGTWRYTTTHQCHINEGTRGLITPIPTMTSGKSLTSDNLPSLSFSTAPTSAGRYAVEDFNGLRVNSPTATVSDHQDLCHPAESMERTHHTQGFGGTQAFRPGAGLESEFLADDMPLVPLMKMNISPGPAVPAHSLEDAAMTSTAPSSGLASQASTPLPFPPHRVPPQVPSIISTTDATPFAPAPVTHADKASPLWEKTRSFPLKTSPRTSNERANLHNPRGRVKKFSGSRPPIPARELRRTADGEEVRVIPCPAPGCGQFQVRLADMHKHLDAHHRDPERFRCIGVPVEMLDQDEFAKLKGKQAIILEHKGQLYVGGCGNVYGRKSSWQRHARQSSRCLSFSVNKSD